MTEDSRKTVRVIDTAQDRKPLLIVKNGGQAHAVLWPGNGAHYRTFNLIELAAGGLTVDLCHEKECAYYIRGGSGLVRDLASDQGHEIAEGSMLHIGAGDRYRIEAGAAGLTAIGGTVPVDPKFYQDYLG